MATNFKVSQSSVKLWRRCRQAYHYKYNEKIKPKTKARPLQFGGLVHSILDSQANGRNSFESIENMDISKLRIFDAEKEMYGNILDDIRYIMNSYFSSQEPLKYAKINGRMSEHQIKVKLVDGIKLSGIIDAITKRNDLRWLTEHKTTAGDFPDSGGKWQDIQVAIYLKAVDLLGWRPLDGVCWNFIKSKPPTRPKLLKNGTLSLRRLNTLPQVIEDSIKKHGMKKSSYLPLIEQAKESESSYFKRFYVPVDTDVKAAIFRDFVSTAREMSELSTKRREKNIDLHCKWCDYEKLCRAEMTGSDVDFVKEREYEISTRD